MFIEVEDYSAVCDEREFDAVQNSEATRKKAEQTAIKEVASYLRTRYDVDKIFAATGDERDEHLVTIVVNVALYYLSQRLPSKMAGEKRETLYDKAIAWLTKVQKGGASPNLPALASGGGTADSTDTFPMAVGGMPRATYTW